jgi:hypothetical protein
MQPAILPEAVGVMHYAVTLIGLTVFTLILVSMITMPKAVNKAQAILWDYFIKIPRDYYKAYMSARRKRSDNPGDDGLELDDRRVRNAVEPVGV